MNTRQATPRNALEPPTVPQGRTPVVATDLDRTFTQEDLRLSPEALRKARQLRAKGVRMVLVTGRKAADLPLPQLRGAFDAMVLEGGAVWGRPGQWTIPPAPPAFWDLAEGLARQGHDVQEGWASFSVSAQANDDLAATSIPASANLNVDRIDVTPSGVDKGTGFGEALADLRIATPWVLSIGDAPNDLPLARMAHASVAVSNAHPSLVEAAGFRSPHAAHRGFLWAVKNVADWRSEARP